MILRFIANLSEICDVIKIRVTKMSYQNKILLDLIFYLLTIKICEQYSLLLENKGWKLLQ